MFNSLVVPPDECLCFTWLGGGALDHTRYSNNVIYGGALGHVVSAPLWRSWKLRLATQAVICVYVTEPQ